MYHGLRVGDTITPVQLPCSDGQSRLLGATSRSELVTFATASDCASCSLVLHGLDTVWRERPRGLEMFFVSYTDVHSEPAALRSFTAETAQPVCFDTTGQLWRRYDISHTPFTLFVHSGVVVFGYDQGLDSPTEQQNFANAVRAHVRTAGPN